jgi:hypothetical protein
MYGPHSTHHSALYSVCGETDVRCKKLWKLCYSVESASNWQRFMLLSTLYILSCKESLHTNCTLNPSQSNRHIAVVPSAPLRSQPPAAGDCTIRLLPRQPSARLQRHQAWLHSEPPCALRRPPRAAAVPPAPLPVAAHPAAAVAEPQQLAGMQRVLHVRNVSVTPEVAMPSTALSVRCGHVTQTARAAGPRFRTHAAAAAQDLQVDEQVADVRGVDAADAAGLAHVPRLHLECTTAQQGVRNRVSTRRAA